MEQKPKFELYEHIEDWEALQAIVQAQMADSFTKVADLQPLKEEDDYGQDVNEMLNNAGNPY